MTSKERLTRAFKREKTDRVPVAPMVNPGWLKLAGKRADEFIKTMDIMMDIHINSDIEIYMGGKIRERLKTRQSGNDLMETVTTPRGELRRISSLDPNMLNWVTKHFFEKTEDFEKFMSFAYEPFVPDVGEYKRWEREIGDEGVVMALIYNATCLPGQWMTPQEFIVMCLDNFPLVEKLLQKASARVNGYVESLCQQGVKYFRIAGTELASQTLMGPEWYARIVGPYDTALVKIIHKHGGIVFTHSHGKVRGILEKVAATGTDALSPLEEPPSGDITIKEARAMIGESLCLVGNLDDLEVLGKKSRQEIKERALRLLDEAAPRGAFILGGTESGMYTEPMLEGFLYLAELGEIYGNY